MHFNQNFGKFFVDQKCDAVGGFDVTFAPGRDRMPVVDVPTDPIHHRAVEHKEGRTAFGQLEKPLEGFINILLGGPKREFSILRPVAIKSKYFIWIRRWVAPPGKWGVERNPQSIILPEHGGEVRKLAQTRLVPDFGGKQRVPPRIEVEGLAADILRLARCFL